MNALRAFDAAARHLSLTKAASELHVTPGAVGHQIHALQQKLQIQLFKKVGNNLELTQQGRDILPIVSSAFISLCLAVDQIVESASKPTVKIAVDITFAGMWLAPKLAEFRQIEPSIDVWVVPPSEFNNPTSGEVDMVIQYAPATQNGFDASLMHNEILVPVCSESYLRDSDDLKQPKDLLKHRLIAVERRAGAEDFPGWAEWSIKFDIEQLLEKVSLHFEHSILAIESALSDQGVALVSLANIGRHLKNGDLVLPLGTEFTLELSRYIVTRSHQSNKSCKLLRNWLTQDVQ